jgi:hypothetical protein
MINTLPGMREKIKERSALKCQFGIISSVLRETDKKPLLISSKWVSIFCLINLSQIDRYFFGQS